MFPIFFPVGKPFDDIFLRGCYICIYIYTYVWVNYNISLTWIKAIWGWFPLLTMISSEVAVRSFYSNLPRYVYVYMLLTPYGTPMVNKTMAFIHFRSLRSLCEYTHSPLQGGQQREWESFCVPWCDASELENLGACRTWVGWGSLVWRKLPHWPWFTRG